MCGAEKDIQSVLRDNKGCNIRIKEGKQLLKRRMNMVLLFATFVYLPLYVIFSLTKRYR